jgi:hypothetical protein
MIDSKVFSKPGTIQFMLTIAQFVATFATIVFAGAALYINLVEHPARMSCPTNVAAMVWAPSYQRATLMQAPLAIVGSLFGMLAWWLGAGNAWLVASGLIFVVVPFTLVVITATNKQLLAPGRDLASSETRSLLVKWGRLHAVRSALSLAASAIMLWELAKA